jgi:hypothetical protein
VKKARIREQINTEMRQMDPNLAVFSPRKNGYMVRMAGLEPARPYGQQILSL